MVAAEGAGLWRSRNPFPLGGVVEDAATGSAAAAFVGYLRDRGQARVGEKIVLNQGVEMGRHSRIQIQVLEERARIQGACVKL